MANLRSPHYTNPISYDSSIAYVELLLYVWDGVNTQPSQPTYTLRKSQITGNDTYFEISELCRDFLDIDFDGNYNSQALWYSYSIIGYDSNGSIVDDDGGGIVLALDSYSYFEEINFIVRTGAMISNRKIFALADNLVRIPIRVGIGVTVTFLNKGNIVGESTYTPSTNTDSSIKYVTINGENNEDTYEERVSSGGGVIEDSACLQDFLNSFNIGEVDNIIISNSQGVLQNIDVVTINECKYEPKKVTFINKFGALQDMHFFKKSVEKIDIKKESYKSNIIQGGSYSRSQHVNRDFNVIGKESVSLSSGYLSEEYNEVFKQLLLSEKVWVTNIINGVEQVLPLNVKTSNITYKTSLNDRLVEYTIDFENSFDTINNIR